MRSALFGIALLCCLGAAQAEGAAGMADCLDAGETREVVASNRIVASAKAVVAARGAVPGAEIVRANLCRVDDRLLYIIMALRRDGRFAYVTIDAISGKVVAVQ